MKIQKISHSCIIVDEQGVRIMFDPGVFSKKAADEEGVDLLIITHKHSDHFHVETINRLKQNNPNMHVITNFEVGELLDNEGIEFESLEDGDVTDFKGVAIEAFGSEHAYIYKTIPEVVNTGYMVAEKFFHPGDSYTVPNKSVEILCLPLGAPWGKISESMDYALEISPKACFPVHDSMLTHLGSYQNVAEKILVPAGIEFTALGEGEEL